MPSANAQSLAKLLKILAIQKPDRRNLINNRHPADQARILHRLRHRYLEAVTEEPRLFQSLIEAALWAKVSQQWIIEREVTVFPQFVQEVLVWLDGPENE